jgi:hypothetical protein
MVLSENNEPLKNNYSSREATSPKAEMNSSTPASVPNPVKKNLPIESSKPGPKRMFKLPDVKNVSKKINVRKDKILPAFVNIASAISLLINIILVVVVLILSREQFVLKRMLVRDVLGGLYVNFGNMDQASISKEILVEDNILVDFPLQIDQDTEVTLTADTPISGARVTLSTGGLNILSAPTNITLPAGTRLPIHLNMTVPVSATVPISLTVPVNIPLSETELHQPFTNLQKVVQPYLFSFMDAPFYWQEIPACKVFGSICNWWFK